MLKNNATKTNRVRLNVESLERRLVLDRTVLDMTHVHISPEFDGSVLSIQLEDTSTNTFYNPADVLLYLSPSTQAIQPAGWNFIGAGDGNQFWQLPEEKDPSVLTVAFSGEDIDPGTFDTYTPRDPRIGRAGEWIKVSLRDVTGPGDFSVWQDFQAPSAWWMSTVDGGRTYDPAFYLEPGGDNHINAGFTAAGAYMVTFEASAFLNGHGLPIRSDPATLCFGVETTDCGDGGGRPGAHSAPTTLTADPALVSVSLLSPVSQRLTPAPVQATVSLTESQTPTAPQSIIPNEAVGMSQPASTSAVPPVLGRTVDHDPAAAEVNGDALAVGIADALTW